MCLQAFAADYFPETYDATPSSENQVCATDQQAHCTATHGPTNTYSMHNIRTYHVKRFRIILISVITTNVESTFTVKLKQHYTGRKSVIFHLEIISFKIDGFSDNDLK